MTTPAPVRRQALTGNKAAAHALKLARTQVLCYFPIGPSDEVGEELSRMIQRGELPAEVIELEHERSVMNAQITATQSGARCSFATNSEGLLIAAQQLIFASYARIPIVVVVAHRALEPPAIVRSDDQDTIMYRDIHWLHYHCENAQDVLDTVIQAYKVSEDPEVLLPAFVTYDGWKCPITATRWRPRPRKPWMPFLPPFVLPPEVDFVKNLDFAAYYGGQR